MCKVILFKSVRALSQPSVLEHLIYANPLRWVLLKHLGQQVFAALAHELPERVQKSERLHQRHLFDLRSTLTFERKVRVDQCE